MKFTHLTFCVFVFILSGCQEKPADSLYIAVASNVQQATAEIVRIFEDETGYEIELIVNSSGNLATQIENGLQADVFISADMQYPMSLYRGGIGKESPLLYAHGELVILSHGDLPPSFESMVLPEARKIAIAHPTIAPYGLKAILALRNAGVLEEVQEKLVNGQSAAEAFQFVRAGAAELGLVAKSFVIGANTDADKWAEIEDALYNPLAQGMLLIEYPGRNTERARQFFEFMVSDAAGEVLQKYGYRVP